MKVNCTRNRTLIAKEINKSEKFITKEFTDEELSILLGLVESSIRRKNDFSGKLEENVEKKSMAVEVKDIISKETDKFTHVSEKLINFISEATGRMDQRMILERSLQERIATVKSVQETINSRLD